MCVAWNLYVTGGNYVPAKVISLNVRQCMVISNNTTETGQFKGR